MTGGPRVVRIASLGASWRIEPRTVRVAVALAALLVLLAVLDLGSGSYPVAVPDVLAVLLGGGDAVDRLAVVDLRLPRVATAMLVGAALAVAGGILQRLVRNPLGSPDVVGISQGATAAAVLQIVVFGGGTLAVAASAFGGAVAAAVATYALAFRRGLHGSRLVLVGVGIAAGLTAITQYLLARAPLETAVEAFVWTNGSLENRSWSDAAPVGAALVLLLPAAIVLGRRLVMLELGDAIATSVGVRVQRAVAALLVVVVGLTAAATAAAGPVLFVALAAPQVARRLSRSSGAGTVVTALTGAVLLVGSDVLGQRVLPDAALPVGVTTGLLGGVFLCGLLVRERRRRR